MSVLILAAENSSWSSSPCGDSMIADNSLYGTGIAVYQIEACMLALVSNRCTGMRPADHEAYGSMPNQKPNWEVFSP